MTSIRKRVKNNSSVLLSIGAGIGVIATAYLSGKASMHAIHILDEEGDDLQLKDKVELVWQLYIPTGIVAATTIVCVIGVKHVDARKTLAAQTALAVSQRAYESYRAQVVEEFGDRKDKIIVAKAAEKRVTETPPPIVVGGEGSVICFEGFTGRYFMSDMETLQRAVNEVNAKLLSHDYATLDDLYYQIGLDPTMTSSRAGWESPRLLALEFSTVLSKGRPCLAFDYNYVKSF